MTKPHSDATIILRSGHYFDYLDPDQATIFITDIAWGLAYTCRFAGQSTEFYSVAQHSLLVSKLVPPELTLAALLHDAAEAYCGDIPSPLKRLLPDYKLIEQRVEAAIAKRFGVSAQMHPAIKHADLVMLRTEQRDLTMASGHSWKYTSKYAPLAARILPQTATVAANNFLARYHKLGGYYVG